MENYLTKLKQFEAELIKMEIVPAYGHSAEMAFESFHDWSAFRTLNDVKRWFVDKRNNADMQVTEIPLKDTTSWNIDDETGNIKHDSDDFFCIHGINVGSNKRESSKSWDQPILTQVGFDGGILGLVRKRFSGVPHYLCEAKQEPGNYGKVQISPTLQATFANLNQKHGGRKPYFSELFEAKQHSADVKVLFDAWLAEDGGRLYLKRNRGMLVEVSEGADLPLPNDDFIWLSLYQIKALLNEDAWVNPHVRGIIAHA